MTVGLERLLLIIDANEKGAVRGINATTAASGRMGAEVSAQSKAASSAMLGIGTAGLVAGAAMMLPGISGANILASGSAGATRQPGDRRVPAHVWVEIRRGAAASRRWRKWRVG